MTERKLVITIRSNLLSVSQRFTKWDAIRKSISLLGFSAFPFVVGLTGPSSNITPASKVEVGHVQLPQLSRSQWEMLRQEQSGHLEPIPLDIGLSVDHGKVYNVSVYRGTGYPDIDTTVVRWIAANWKTYPWFAGGNSYVVALTIDPALRQIVFRGA